MTRKPTRTLEPREIESADTSLGRLAETSHFGTARDIRLVLEDRSTDVELSAYELLVRPNRGHLRLTEERRRELGAAALNRYCDTGSTCASDYSEMLEGIVDPLTFEWRVDRFFEPPPIGKRS